MACGFMPLLCTLWAHCGVCTCAKIIDDAAFVIDLKVALAPTAKVSNRDVWCEEGGCATEWRA